MRVSAAERSDHIDADFPAAHSMDTTWYAIDCEGHVAQFHSGENGAVPARCAHRGPATDLHELDLTRFPASDRLLDLAGSVLPGALAGPVEHPAVGFSSARELEPEQYILFLKDIEPVRSALAAGLVRQVPAVAGLVALLVDHRAQALVLELHCAELCQGCFSSIDVPDENDEIDLLFDTSAGRRGFFLYSHIDTSYACAPYGRYSVPGLALHIDQVPPPLRGMLSQCEFNLNFRESPHIQPVEHVACRFHWMGDFPPHPSDPATPYLCSDGKTIRGIENAAAHREVYELFCEEHPGVEIEIEPPRGGS